MYIIANVVLLKALLPVCMKYRAQGESQVANIARDEAECYISHETLAKSLQGQEEAACACIQAYTTTAVSYLH